MSVGDSKPSLGWMGQYCINVLGLKETINHCLKKRILSDVQWIYLVQLKNNLYIKLNRNVM